MKTTQLKSRATQSTESYCHALTFVQLCLCSKNLGVRVEFSNFIENDRGRERERMNISKCQTARRRRRRRTELSKWTTDKPKHRVKHTTARDGTRIHEHRASNERTHIHRHPSHWMRFSIRLTRLTIRIVLRSLYDFIHGRTYEPYTHTPRKHRNAWNSSECVCVRVSERASERCAVKWKCKEIFMNEQLAFS